MSQKNNFKKILSLIKGALPGSKSIVGIDFGMSSIKVSVVSKVKKNQYKLIAFASSPLPEGALIEDEIQNEEEILEALELAMKEAKVKTVNAAISLYGPNVVVRKFTLGDVEDELEEQINWEAEQYIPFPIDETALSHSIIGENEGGGLDILLVAARLDIMDSFVDLVESSGFNLKIVDSNYVALANILENSLGDEISENSSYLVIDFGAYSVNVLIAKKDSILFNKDINMGGASITEEIQRQLGLNYFEAEELKIIGDDKGNLPEEVVEIINENTDKMVGEIKKSVDFHLNSNAEESLEKIFITGGSSLIPGLAEKIESLLGVETHFLNPFTNISVDSKKVGGDLLEEATYLGAISVGLSLRGSSDK